MGLWKMKRGRGGMIELRRLRPNLLGMNGRLGLCIPVRKLGVGGGVLGGRIGLVEWIGKMMILLRMPESQRRRCTARERGRPRREEEQWDREGFSRGEGKARISHPADHPDDCSLRLACYPWWWTTPPARGTCLVTIHLYSSPFSTPSTRSSEEEPKHDIPCPADSPISAQKTFPHSVPQPLHPIYLPNQPPVPRIISLISPIHTGWFGLISYFYPHVHLPEVPYLSASHYSQSTPSAFFS
jgi:hypothetical protein